MDFNALSFSSVTIAFDCDLKSKVSIQEHSHLILNVLANASVMEFQEFQSLFAFYLSIYKGVNVTIRKLNRNIKKFLNCQQVIELIKICAVSQQTSEDNTGYIKISLKHLFKRHF